MNTHSRSLQLLSRNSLCILAALTLLPGTLHSQAPQAQQTPQPAAGGLAPAGPTFRVLRSMAGTSGTQSGGKLLIDNPQTVFHLGQDHKVIVYFEWEGPIGLHKFEGLWKNPEGNVVMVSDFQYTATGKQFAGYWTMLLSGSEPVGIWTLQARIDGEDAGSFPFQLVTEPGAPAPVQPAPERQPLSTDALYKKALSATVFVDMYDASGKRVSRGSGFYLDDGRLFTAFHNIDGAKLVRVTLPDGHFFETTQVVSWSRWQDWAMLQSEPPKEPGLTRSKAESWPVGTAASYLDLATGSGRILADASVVGITSYPRAGERLNITSNPSDAAVGGPVFDGFGDVIGMVGGSLVPGTDLLISSLLAAGPNASGGSNVARYGMAIPITFLPANVTSEAPVTFDHLIQIGQMIPPIAAPDRVMYGTLTRSLEKAGGFPFPANWVDRFSHADSKVYAYIGWSTREKFKGLADAILYDVDNHAVSSPRPAKVDIRVGGMQSNYWQFDPSALPSGFYRVDVTLGDQVVWRRFFRVDD